jgi:hypothetical protein
VSGPVQAPGAGCGHYLLSVLASAGALACGTVVAYFMLQDELATAHPGAHVPQDKLLQASEYMGGVFAMGFALVSFVTSIFIAAIMVGVFKKRFRRSYLISYSVVIMLCAIGFGLGVWGLWQTPWFRQVQKDVRAQLARDKASRHDASPRPGAPPSSPPSN